jgi:hypothetical protein
LEAGRKGNLKIIFDDFSVPDCIRDWMMITIMIRGVEIIFSTISDTAELFIPMKVFAGFLGMKREGGEENGWLTTLMRG